MSTSGLYLQLFSPHGLIRGHSPELGRDADTGGQVKYVLELAKEMGRREEVAQVDLVTRLIDDKSVADDYSVAIEPLSEHARIVRIRCGGRKYIRKELLWPHLEEFIDKTIRFIKSQAKSPDLFHGHYADGGYVAMELAAAFDAPFLFTGHSLGSNKRQKLAQEGVSAARMNRQYKLDTRILVEEEIMRKADRIITSTQQEIDLQYGLYSNGRIPDFSVIPPGIDLETFYPFYDLQMDTELLSEEVKQTRFTLFNELHRFWAHPEKPFILALCRPDQRKNISGLLEAYGTSKELRAIANLAIFAGIRSNITAMEDNEQAVLTDMLLQMDRYDLYGKLAIPKRHDFATEVPELYRICAESRGVFVNPALTEPFGLTLIEASACGLPLVATQDGGPRDIVGNCDNGILVDVAQPREIAQALQSILVDEAQWSRFSNNGINGVRNHYSWQAHAEKSLHHILQLLPEKDLPSSQNGTATMTTPRSSASFGKRLTNVQNLLITDIDNTLVGDDASMQELFFHLQERRDSLAWGVSTGRSLELTLQAMTEHNFPMPDILICSVGTEIYYGPDLRYDKGWQRHISWQWKPEQIKEALAVFEHLVFQEAEGQRGHKISYYLEETGNRLQAINQGLQENKLRCRTIYSHGQFLDVLPVRASKGKAVDYIRYKFDFSPRHVMVAGDSGNDEDMITGKSRGLVVGNHSEELEGLRGKANIYFSQACYAAGILDGLKHYGLI
ncbi:HAD-IIB family hydrolase [Desulfogranum mediterraneum]|uniref:HAD-IIB family hydrolase n=1 Tax=Desulfogranum mediterraneum TaxID=160661 RepID=UPI000550EF9C|nr:HAD-IIB family hydrolase [Desulfogranum mediterraneum]